MKRTHRECEQLLRQGYQLIAALDEEDYSWASSSEATSNAVAEQQSAWSSPGAHTRHLLDFVDCLLSGLDARRIDYTARKRRVEVEQSRDAGLREIERAIEALAPLASLDPRLSLEVRPDANQDWSQSTLSRELQFVIGHVIHHYALISLTLAHRGIMAPSNYGIAPSTLAHRDEQAPPSVAPDATDPDDG